tara:strand:+ start:835 stop:1272 length:438 start_codon:yes stop_codon:yes gene_type:complete
MATSTYLSNPGFSILTTAPSTYTDLTDQTHAATVTVKYDALESTAFGGTSRVFTSGLGDHEFTVELYMSYIATETYASLSALVGQACTVNVATSQAALTSATTTAPKFVLTGTYLESLPVIDAKLGELSTISLTFKGGVYSVVTS